MTDALTIFVLLAPAHGAGPGAVMEHEAAVEHVGSSLGEVIDRLHPDRLVVTAFDPRGGRSPLAAMVEVGYDNADRALAVVGDGPARSEGLAAAVTLAASEAGRWDGFGPAWLQTDGGTVVPSPTERPVAADARADAFKLTFLLHPIEGITLDDFRRHWLEVHVPNYASNFALSGGVRYAIHPAVRSSGPELAGLAEISYRHRKAAEAHVVADDGFRAKIGLRALPGRETVILG